MKMANSVSTVFIGACVLRPQSMKYSSKNEANEHAQGGVAWVVLVPVAEFLQLREVPRVVVVHRHVIRKR